MKFLQSIFLLILTGCVPFLLERPSVNNTEPHHGNALRVWIDGQRTQLLLDPVFKGINFFNHISGPGLWNVESSISATPEFKYKFDEDLIGKFIEAKATIDLYTPNAPVKWEAYYSNLSTPSSDFEAGYSVASSHYQTAESDVVYSQLPSGTYLIRLFVYGTKDWDSQAIFVTIP